MLLLYEFKKVFYFGPVFWEYLVRPFCSGDTLRCRFYFPVGGFTPDLSYRANGSRLDSFLSGVRSQQEHSVLRRVSLCSGQARRGVRLWTDACLMNGSHLCGALSGNVFRFPIRYLYAPLWGMIGRGLPHLSRCPTCPTVRKLSASFVIRPCGWPVAVWSLIPASGSWWICAAVPCMALYGRTFLSWVA